LVFIDYYFRIQEERKIVKLYSNLIFFKDILLTRPTAYEKLKNFNYRKIVIPIFLVGVCVSLTFSFSIFYRFFTYNAIDYCLGTYGLFFIIGTFFVGFSFFILIWLIMGIFIKLLFYEIDLEQILFFTGFGFFPLIIMLFYILVMVYSPLITYANSGILHLTFLCVMLLWVLKSQVTAILVLKDQSNAQKVKKYKTRSLIAGCIIFLLLLLPISTYFLFITNLPEANYLSTDSRYVLLTFDTEEDWYGFVHYKGCYNCYFDSYKYFTSGAMDVLLKELNNRNVESTFFITPNMARNEPNYLLDIENYGNEVGVHIHVHTLLNVTYPYRALSEDDYITNYDYKTQLYFLRSAKLQIENVLGYPVESYRSGYLACSPSLEKAVSESGFSIISNHKRNFRLPNGLFQIDSGWFDILNTQTEYEIIEAFERAYNENKNIIVFSGHPSLMYDIINKKVKWTVIENLLNAIDWIKNRYQDVEFVTMKELVTKVHYEYSTSRLLIFQFLFNFPSIIAFFYLSTFTKYKLKLQ